MFSALNARRGKILVLAFLVDLLKAPSETRMFVFDLKKDQETFRLPIRIFLYSTKCLLCRRSPGKATYLQEIY